jgi:hypothetical protein
VAEQSQRQADQLRERVRNLESELESKAALLSATEQQLHAAEEDARCGRGALPRSVPPQPVPSATKCRERYGL